MKFVPLSQLDGSNPGTWPAYYKILLWLFIIAILAGGYYQFIRTPLMEEQESLQAQIDKRKNEFQKLLQETHDLDKHQKRFMELVRILEEHLKYLPAREEVPELIDAVYDAGVNNSINFTRISPLKEQKEKYYDINPVTLEANTGYSNFAHFAEAIAQLERILNVSDMKITMNKSAEVLDVKSTLQTYVYNFNFDELVKKHKIGVQK